MKSNYIHVCFVIDESGSMYSSKEDVIGGVQKVVDEQKANTNGTCSISLYKFNSSVIECYTFKDVNSIPEFQYNPSMCTALNDGIGTAIDSIGKKLAEMDEDERPEQNMIVIITDGYENASKEYTFEQCKKMIKHQEDKYNWKFIYLGVDLASMEQADRFGFKNQGYSVRSKMSNMYDAVNSSANVYRNTEGDYSKKSATLDASLYFTTSALNAEYLADTTSEKADLSNV